MTSKVSSTDQNNEFTGSALRSLQGKQRRWEAAFYFCFAFLAASASLVIAAAIFAALGFSVDPISNYFRHVLLVLIFPAAFLTAHCMDRVMETRTAIRIAQCERNGMRTGSE